MNEIFEPTIIALSTPQGVGAIALIRLSGAKAIEVVNDVFKGKNLNEQKSHSLHFGKIMQGDEVLDEVVVGIYCAPNSYTSENIAEISCHASPFIINAIINLLLSRGVVLAKPGEFTMRAFLNGKLDLSQAEAVADLIASKSASAHKIAMNQMRGGFSNELAVLRKQLIDFAALIELELDFSEEDVEFADRSQLTLLIDTISLKIKTLLQTFETGNAIKNGIPIVIAGKPNVGKSTLLNTLLNEERAIVSAIAGTTRDTVEDELILNGITFRFIDTAGLRQTTDEIEAIGVARSLEKIKQAAIVLLICTPEQTREEIIAQQKELADYEVKSILIINKADLLNTDNKQNYATLEPVFISAKNKTGIEELKNKLLQQINLASLNDNEVIVSNLRHAEALRETEKALKATKTGLASKISGDFVATDIRRALYHLGEITGSIANEDLLDSIFFNFCIGK